MTNVDPTYVEVDSDWMNDSFRDPFKIHCEGRTRHGMMYFSAPYITLLDEAGDGYHELYHGGCDSKLVLPREIKNVLSLYKWEQYIIPPDHDYKIHTVTMYDAEGDVDDREVRELAKKLNEFREDGPTLVHCQAGLNRSSLVAGASLILSGRFTPEEAVKYLREKRSDAVLCNKSFEKYLLDFDVTPV